MFLHICMVKRGYSWHNSLESESKCSTHLLLVCAVMMRVVPNEYIVCWSHTMPHRQETPETMTPECIWLWTELCCSRSVTSHCRHTLSHSHVQLHPRGSQNDLYLSFPGLLFKAQGHGVCEGAGAMLCVQCWWGQKSVSYALEFKLQMVVRWQWKLNSGPLTLSNKQVLITTEPSLSPPNSSSGRLCSLLSSNRLSHLSEVGGSAELSWLSQYHTFPHKHQQVIVYILHNPFKEPCSYHHKVDFLFASLFCCYIIWSQGPQLSRCTTAQVKCLHL